jgi:tetratricopeptide (TPR) repeat protein
MNMQYIVRQPLALLLPAFLLLISLPGCGGLGKMDKAIEELNLKMTPEPLIVRGGQVQLALSGTFPEKYFAKKAIVEATPVLVWEGGEAAFETVGFQGEDAAGNYTVVPFKTPKSFDYSGKIDFQEGMEDGARLELRISGSMGSKSMDFTPVVLGDGVITTPNWVSSDDRFVKGTDQFQRVISYTEEAEIHYAYNRSNVRSAELRDDDMSAMKDFLGFAAAHDSVVLKGTSVSAYASPEGEITLNEDLAMERAESANAAVAKLLKRAKITTEDGFFGNNPKGEDWEGFQSLMRASNIEDKDLILRVLSMYSDKNRREEEIKNIAKTYTEIEKEILPALRRSMITLRYDIEGYSDEELMALAMSNPDTLTVEESLYAATLFESNEDMLKVYASTSRVHAGDWRGPNNEGVCLMEMGKLNQAADRFMAADERGDSPIINNNLGAVARMKGNLSDAKRLLGSASGAGDAVKYNKGILAIQEGNYSQAVSNFSGENTANAALAKLLNGDANGAKTILNNAKDESAVGHYILAIANARLGNSTEAKEHRDMAVQKDAGLAAKASADLEFRDLD